jgi:P4 family phage/plasmid primase-like protien
MTDFKKNPLYLKKQKKSLFVDTGFEYKEYPDIPLVLGFLENKMGVKLRKKMAEYYTDEQTHYTSYIKNVVFTLESEYEGYIPITYFMSKTGWGRINAGRSLSMNVFHRPTRHAFASKNYIDFDMVNCQIQLLYELAKKAGLSTAGLKEYCADSKAMRRAIAFHYNLKDIKNEDGTILTAYEQAKKLPIRLAFGGGLSQWKKDYHVGDMIDLPLVLKLQATISQLCEKVCEVNQHIYNDLLKYSKEWSEKSEDERLRSLLASYAQTWERVIQEECIAHLIRTYSQVHIEDIISCQDGFMVLKGQMSDINTSILQEQFMKIILKKFDIIMNWEIKPFDEAIPIPPSMNPTETNEILVKIQKESELLKEQTTKLTDFKTPEPFDYSIAEDLYFKYCFAENETNKIKENQIIVSSGRKSQPEWYYFKNGKWECSTTNTFLREIISNEYIKPFENQIKLITENISILEKQIVGSKSSKEADDMIKSEIRVLQRKIDSISEITHKCKNSGGKDNIMKELFDKCEVQKFVDKLDLNPYLLCCKNGVIDIKNRIFREGKPSDMCSISTNINYIEEHADKIKEDAMDFFEKVFPFESQREYMFNHLASCLIGSNMNQAMNYYIGKGSNGKSLLVELMGLIMGDYKASVPLSLITQKRQTIGGTSSEVACLRGTRYAVIQEPSVGDTINEGVFKELTGGDPLTARGLFKDPITFTPMFNLIICANLFLNIKSNDDGTWRRIKVIEFSSKFVDNPVLTNEEEFKYLKDTKLKEKMVDWAEYVLYLLVQKAYETQGIVGSFEMVDCATERYRLSQDRIGQFIKDCIIFGDISEKETKETLSSEFKHWFELNFKYSVKAKELFDRLETHGLSSNSTTFFGLKIKNYLNSNEEVVSNEDIFIEAFNNSFELTNDFKKDFIKCSYIQEWAKNKGLKIDSSKQINDILLSSFGFNTKNKDRRRYKKVNGTSVDCWFGVKLKSQSSESIEEEETDSEGSI